MIDDSREKECWTNDKLLVGVDEAGLGCVAGSCFVAGVAFPKDYDFSKKLSEVNDSKKLPEKKRRELATIIMQEARYYFIEKVTPRQIDAGSAYHLRFDAARRGIRETFKDIDCVVYMDGNAAIKDTGKTEHTLIKGDGKCYSIAAASILAKVDKDDEMIGIDVVHPDYHFASNKGYGTKNHIAAIKKLGLVPAHRKTFCKSWI